MKARSKEEEGRREERKEDEGWGGSETWKSQACSACRQQEQARSKEEAGEKEEG